MSATADFPSFKKSLLLFALFAVAMAYVESAVVVYLREIHYPLDFRFPFKDIPVGIYYTELAREAATLIMLWAISGIVANTRREWFAYFMFNFGIWDIWYYIWLKLLLDWPSSLLDWDVLFLLPVTWMAPVLAPLLVSCALIFAAIVILKRESSGEPLMLSVWYWLLEFLAGGLILVSFFVYNGTGDKPEYPWWLFFCGFLSGLIGLAVNVLRRSGRKAGVFSKRN